MNKAPMPLDQNGKLDLSQVKNGVMLLTFDDSSYETWLPQLDLFDFYNARATFFYSKEITEAVADSMKTLMARGHSVGLHTIAHKEAVNITMEEYYADFIRPQIEQAASYGIRELPFFAYPNNRHSPETDEALSVYFTRFRAGAGITAPKGYWIADFEEPYLALDKIPARKAMGGCGIGPYYDSTQENLDAALEKAAKENKLITFYSHAILPEAVSVHISCEMLEKTLAKAASLGMAIVGFKELPEA